MGFIFERMCHDYLLYYAQGLPFEILSLGKWWGNNPVERKEIEIDIVGETIDIKTGEKAYVVCSCKYRNKQIGRDELELLRQYASVFSKGKKCHYIIFSKDGFTQGLYQSAEAGEVILYSLDDIYSSI